MLNATFARGGEVWGNIKEEKSLFLSGVFMPFGTIQYDAKWATQRINWFSCNWVVARWVTKLSGSWNSGLDFPFYKNLRFSLRLSSRKSRVLGTRFAWHVMILGKSTRFENCTHSQKTDLLTSLTRQSQCITSARGHSLMLSPRGINIRIAWPSYWTLQLNDDLENERGCMEFLI